MRRQRWQERLLGLLCWGVEAVWLMLRRQQGRQLAMQEDLCRHRAQQQVQWWREVEDRPRRQEKRPEMQRRREVGAQRRRLMLLERLQELLW